MKNKNHLISLSLLFLSLILLPEIVAANNLKRVKSWGYQLQNVSPIEINRSPFDLVVVEPAYFTEKGQHYFSYDEVQLMKQKNSKQKRLVLAYISIGEAENYRSYWKKSWVKYPPTWLGVENKNWKGNFKVRFWETAWQRIILLELEKILKAGYDGVYLDIVDGYWYWQDKLNYSDKLEKRKPNDPYNQEAISAKRMVNWIHKITRYSRKISDHSNSEFLIFPQNGEDIIRAAPKKQQKIYWQDIDGIGIESVYYIGEREMNNAFNPDKYRLNNLKNFIKKEKTVLNIEYISTPNKIRSFYKTAKKQGFIPYVNSKELDKLNTPAEIN